MNKRRAVMTVAAFAAVACGCLLYMLFSSSMPDLSNALRASTPPRISPDYSALVIPPAIAPLNFTIEEPGSEFVVVIHSRQGRDIKIKAKEAEVRIPLRPWRNLLSVNSGKTIAIDIYSRSGFHTWKRFPSIIDTVSTDSVDRFLVYRLMPPLYTTYGKMGIYQRNVTTFREKPLWLNRMSDNNCMNCHTFKHNDPDYFIVHMRGGPGNGTLVRQGGNIFKVNTATDFNRPAGYPAWHPSGNSIAFSVNTIRQFFHATGGNREGCDMGSKIILYDIQSNTESSPACLSDPAEMPTQPEWSPGGDYLYYCSAPQFPPDSLLQYHTKILYDLFRIRYNPAQDTWGSPEMVLSHDTAGGSISFPKISPDGRFMLFCLSAHGTFPVFRPGGDIYIMDLKSQRCRKLDVNSNEPESFPRWSSNGRWFVFASKRMDGISGRLYFSHVDSSGNASKPFLLPQKNPRNYHYLLRTYNLPELISRPFAIPPRKLVRAFQDNGHRRNVRLSDVLKKRLPLSLKQETPDLVPAEPWGKPRAGSTTH